MEIKVTDHWTEFNFGNLWNCLLWFFSKLMLLSVAAELGLLSWVFKNSNWVKRGPAFSPWLGRKSKNWMKSALASANPPGHSHFLLPPKFITIKIFTHRFIQFWFNFFEEQMMSGFCSLKSTFLNVALSSWLGRSCLWTFLCWWLWLKTSQIIDKELNLHWNVTFDLT